MNQIKVNPSNKKYYSEDFVKGFECGTERQLKADLEYLDKIKNTSKENTNKE